MRLFTAVTPPMEIIEQIVPDFDKYTSMCKFNAVDPANMHITLNFIGEVNDKKLPSVIECVDNVYVRPFEFTFDRVSFFKKGKMPNVFFASGSSRQMGQISNSIRHCLVDKGFHIDDRPYKAHMTFMRIKSVSNSKALLDTFKDDNIDFDPVSFEVEKIDLYESKLDSKGPVYNIIHEKIL